MIDLKAIEARCAAAITRMDQSDEQWAEGTAECVAVLRAAVPALVARVRELEAEKEARENPPMANWGRL